jgi:hypothetical protein
MDQSAKDALNKSVKIEEERRLKVKSQFMPYDEGPEATTQQVRRGGQLKSSEEDERSR